MPDLAIQVATVSALLPNGVRCLEAPAFPEVSVVETDPARAAEVLGVRIRQVLEQIPLFEWHRRMGPPALEPGYLEIRLVPPKRQPFWSEPLLLPVHYVVWSQDEDTRVAVVPTLGVQAVVQGRQSLERRLEEELRAALGRQRRLGSLGGLAQLSLPTRLEVGRIEVRITARTARQEAQAAAAEANSGKPVLEEVGVDLARLNLHAAWEQEACVERLAELLGGDNPRSVLLLGTSGCGKTAVFLELVRRREEFGFGHTPFHATSGARLVAGMSGFGMWQERCLKLVREASHRRAIVHLGGLFELMNVGASTAGRQGIGAFLRPYLARGELLAVAEVTPEEWREVEARDPQMAQALELLRVEEPDEPRLRRILQAAAGELAQGRHRDLAADGLEAILRLHARYAAYSARPGRPLRFLRDLMTGAGARGAADEGAVDEAQVNAAFSRETGLPTWLLNDREVFEPDAARAWFASRVIGQPEAVQEVVGTLALVKTRLARPHRPLASFLFVGPTGVGKTEMVKALAEFLFGDRQRMVRFDMSEFAHPGAAERLAGGAWDKEGLLTSRLREQPFCVVLLDEFEKADPGVHDLLLQVLGEARLTDAAGRIAGFGNAVVVLTSNLGAAEFQRATTGFNPARLGTDGHQHFTRVVERFLRPEMVNRLDAIIPFAPLDPDGAMAVTRRELQLAMRRDGVRLRPVELELDPDVGEHLMRAGFDPAHGARPLKRVIERQLLVPLAYALNEFAEDQAVRVQVRLEEGRVAVRAAGRRTDHRDPAERLLRDAVDLLTARRRQWQRLRASPAQRDLENQIQRGEHCRERALRGEWLDAEGRAALTRLPLQRALLERTQAEAEACAAAETNAMVALLEGHGDRQQLAAARGAVSDLDRAWREVLEEFLWLRTAQPDRLTLGLYFREDAEAFGPWALGHVALARRWGFRVEGHVFQAGAAIQIGRHALQLKAARDIERVLERAGADLAFGVVLGIEGRLARPRWGGLAGWHEVRRGNTRHRFLAVPGPAGLNAYQPPEALSARAWGRETPAWVFEPDERQFTVAGGTPSPWSGEYEDAFLDHAEAWFNGQLELPLAS